VELARVEGLSHGDLVASQMLDVAVRVHTIRPFAVQQMSLLLENPFVIFGFSSGSARAPNMAQVLYAASWICGEYIEYVMNKIYIICVFLWLNVLKTNVLRPNRFLPHPTATLMAMLEARVTQLPHNIQSVYLHNCLKILSHIMTKSSVKKPEAPKTADLLDGGNENGDGDGAETVETDQSQSVEESIDFLEIQEKLKVFLSSEELEVQERAGTLHNFIKCYLKLQSKGHVDDLGEIAVELASAFKSELNPVASKAQKKVPVPEGLDLDTWINDPPSESEEEEEDDYKSSEVFSKHPGSGDYGGFAEKKPTYEPSPEEISQVLKLTLDKDIMFGSFT
jgi:AP-3 complex subunit delta-1